MNIISPTSSTQLRPNILLRNRDVTVQIEQYQARGRLKISRTSLNSDSPINLKINALLAKSYISSSCGCIKFFLISMSASNQVCSQQGPWEKLLNLAIS